MADQSQAMRALTSEIEKDERDLSSARTKLEGIKAKYDGKVADAEKTFNQKKQELEKEQANEARTIESEIQKIETKISERNHALEELREKAEQDEDKKKK